MSDWIEVLKKACLAASQAQVAKKMGCSSGTVSLLLACKYPGDVEKMEKKFRAEYLELFLDVACNCPLLGNISAKSCAEWQQKPFAATNEFRVMMYKQCRSGCKYSKIVEDK